MIGRNGEKKEVTGVSLAVSGRVNERHTEWGFVGRAGRISGRRLRLEACVWDPRPQPLLPSLPISAVHRLLKPGVERRKESPLGILPLKDKRSRLRTAVPFKCHCKSC